MDFGVSCEGPGVGLDELGGSFQLRMVHDSVIPFSSGYSMILGMSGQCGHQDFGISGIFLGCPVQGWELDSRILVRP